MSTSRYNLNELGRLVHLLVKGGDLDAAQSYLDVMQARISALREIAEPMEVAQTSESEPVQSRGPLRDAQGNVTRISVLIEERGYDPDAHDNKELKIFCDDNHIPTAHTADTVEGLVRYYEKDGRGRIKTRERRGRVEIRGI